MPEGVSIVVYPEDLRALEHVRGVLGRLVDADIEIGGHGLPPLTLLADDLESLVSKIRASKARDEFGGLRPFGGGNIRVLELNGGRLA